MGNDRVAWVDRAKGICIVFVVMMHSVLGVEAAAGQTGWMHGLVEFAKPFRMPDFFLISGLFLANVIDRDWRLYLDSKVVHFAYFYILWLAIQFGFKSFEFASDVGWSGVLGEYFLALVQPFGTLWFIYLLPIFFIVTKAAHQARIPWPVTLVVAALIHIAPVSTGSVIIDEFASRFIFFFSGFVFAGSVFRLAAQAAERPLASLAALVGWVVLNGSLVFYGFADQPVISIVLGYVGAGAIILISVLLTRYLNFEVLRYLGENSIVVYLAFFLPMAVTRVILLKLGWFDIGTTSLLVTLAGVTGPVVLFWLVQRFQIGLFLFRRPAWARISDRNPRKSKPQVVQ